MKLLNTFITLWLLLACSSHAGNVSWKFEIEKTIRQADNVVQDMDIGSYWNKDYRKAVFSVSNLISSGWSRADFDADLYNSMLKEVWQNTERLHVLNDNVIKLAALKWRINLKNRCFDSGVDLNLSRKYFTDMINSNENIIKTSAIDGLGIIGEKDDVDRLIVLLINNQNNVIGETALNSLFLINDSYTLKSLEKSQNKISNQSIKSKIKEVFGHNRKHEKECIYSS